MMTKAKGEHATFTMDCHRCGNEQTVTNGRPDRHECDFRTKNLEAIQWEIDNPLTLDSITAALDAK